MNVRYDELNTTDVATLLGVDRHTITLWCRKGYIQYMNVGEGTERPRYKFDEDEVERVSKLIEQYGYKRWTYHCYKKKPEKTKSLETTIAVSNPEDYIPDTDEVIDYVNKLRALKVQRDKLLAEVDSIDEAIKTMKEKIMESI